MPFPEKLNHSDFLDAVRLQLRRNLPLAVYRVPGTDQLKAVLQDGAELLEFGNPEDQGFVFAPFAADGPPKTILRPDRFFTSPFSREAVLQAPVMPDPDHQAREIHEEAILGAIAAIRSGPLRKVVLARRFSVPFDGEALAVFGRLAATYPAAYSYLLHHPALGTWMGASPELLLNYSEGWAETVSLAGTQAADPSGLARWGSKELDEQEVVTRYVLERIRSMGLEPQAGQQESVRAGTVWHLRTPVRMRASARQLPELINQLHPTPAVCGYPPQEARAFIKDHENFSREYYTGFLGEQNLEMPESVSFYVNLRCMQVFGDKAYIYVGGGITAASDPRAEWEETRLKSATILSILNI